MSNNRQCRVLANRFRKFLKGEPKKFSYEVVFQGNKLNIAEGKSISDISLKLSGFDESQIKTVHRKSIRKCKSVGDQLTVEKSNLPKRDLDKGKFISDVSQKLSGFDESEIKTVYRKSVRKYKSVGDRLIIERESVYKRNADAPEEELFQRENITRTSLLRKSKNLKPSSQLNCFVPKNFSKHFKQHKAIYSPSTPTSSRLSFEDEGELKSIRGIFPGRGIYNSQTKISIPDTRRTSNRKRNFLRNFRRTSVRYSSRRKKRKLHPSKSATYNEAKTSTPLRRSFSGNDVVDSFYPTKVEEGKLFGRLLEDICDKNEYPPQSIFIMLEDLSRRGPSEVGVFRKSGNARIVRELKASLDREEELNLSNNTPVSIVASLFKDFLRSLPNCLFCSELYDQWLELCSQEQSTTNKKVYIAQHLCSCIPGSHRILVKLLLYVLNLIASNSDFNMMTSTNLGICLGPSILNSGKDFNYNPKVSEVVSFMISNFDEVFGEGARMSLEKLLLRKTFKNSEEDVASEYTEQFLSETTKRSRVFSSLDSGISSGSEDNYYSDIACSFPSTHVSCVSLDSRLSTDEIDTRVCSVNFQRNNWTRKGVMKKRSLCKNVKVTVDLVTVL